MSRKIQAPGIELREIDKSGYNNKPNYSIVDTVSLICGFADKGEDYTTQWINSKQTLEEYYGKPTNEPEMYFHNAAIEILNKGGICLTSKLPYNNLALDKFNSVTYQLDTTIYDISGTYYQQLSAFDPYVTKYLKIKPEITTDTITIDQFDQLKVGSKNNDIFNKITIVDITRTKYESIDDNCVSSAGHINAWTNDCIGIIPVITTPMNALYFQNYQDQTFNYESVDVSAVIDKYNPTSQLTLMSTSQKKNLVSVDIDTIVKHFNLDLSSSRGKDNIQFESTFPSESVSQIATSKFPTIQFLTNLNYTAIDKTYLKSIGVVVFKATKDSSTQSNINLEVVESFAGSLDRTATDPTTNATMFIDDIVNRNSKYVNIFTNIRKQILDKVDIISINNSTCASLGFYKVELQKNVNYANSIIRPLTHIFDANSNSNIMPIDLVIDAGVSNLAQIAKSGDVDFTTNTRIKNHIFELKSKDDTNCWITVLKQYDNFCRYTRRDCMFIADGLRTFCLVGDEKRVRKTDIGSSVVKDILPNLKYLFCLNSSYSAGYCDWFYQADYFSSDLFWCPPSIKAAGIMTYTDAYYHKWDAPAGIVRGKVNSAVDCAFSGTNDECGKIYNQSWNYALNFPIDGIVLEGQKTFQLKKTAFDRINVRRLFLYLEKQVIRIGRYFLYQQNTAYLRQRFVDTITPVFEDAVNGQGIAEYLIKCDDENNTANTIDNNELHCQIAVKPVKAIEFIVLDFVCTNQSAVVNESVFNGIS